jgi:Stress responsive A/B Barrel Domain
MVAKHVLLAKFKEEVTAEQQEELIRGYASLVSLVPSMKAFHW